MMPAMSTTRTDQVAVDDGAFDLHVWVPEPGPGPGILLHPGDLRRRRRTSAPSAERLAEPRLRRRRARRVLARPAQLGGRPRRGRAARPRSAMVRQVRLRRRAWPTAWPRSHTLAGAARGRRAASGVIGFCLGGTLACARRRPRPTRRAASATTARASPACSTRLDNGRPARSCSTSATPTPTSRASGSTRSSAAIAGRADVELNVAAGAGHAFDNHEAAMFCNEAAADGRVGADDGASSAQAPARRRDASARPDRSATGSVEQAGCVARASAGGARPRWAQAAGVRDAARGRAHRAGPAG